MLNMAANLQVVWAQWSSIRLAGNVGTVVGNSQHDSRPPDNVGTVVEDFQVVSHSSTPSTISEFSD